MPIARRVPSLFHNLRKIRETDLPLLVIHGENDRLLRVEQGQMLYDASPSQHKTLVRLPNVDHANTLLIAPDEFFRAIQMFTRT